MVKFSRPPLIPGSADRIRADNLKTNLVDGKGKSITKLLLGQVKSEDIKFKDLDELNDFINILDQSQLTDKILKAIENEIRDLEKLKNAKTDTERCHLLFQCAKSAKDIGAKSRLDKYSKEMIVIASKIPSLESIKGYFEGLLSLDNENKEKIRLIIECAEKEYEIKTIEGEKRISVLYEYAKLQIKCRRNADKTIEEIESLVENTNEPKIKAEGYKNLGVIKFRKNEDGTGLIEKAIEILRDQKEYTSIAKCYYLLSESIEIKKSQYIEGMLENLSFAVFDQLEKKDFINAKKSLIWLKNSYNLHKDNLNELSRKNIEKTISILSDRCKIEIRESS